jgi:hypothetical protein
MKKGIIGNEKGILIPYEEFKRKIGIADEYIVLSSDCQGNEKIGIYLAKKSDIEIKDSLVTIRGMEDDEGSICLLKTKSEINKKLAVNLECPTFCICLKSEDGQIKDGGTEMIKIWAATGEKNIYAWFLDKCHWCAYGPQYFVEIK